MVGVVMLSNMAVNWFFNQQRHCFKLSIFLSHITSWTRKWQWSFPSTKAGNHRPLVSLPQGDVLYIWAHFKVSWAMLFSYPRWVVRVILQVNDNYMYLKWPRGERLHHIQDKFFRRLECHIAVELWWEPHFHQSTHWSSGEYLNRKEDHLAACQATWDHEMMQGFSIIPLYVQSWRKM